MHTLASELERQRSHAERLCKERDAALRKEQLLSAKVCITLGSGQSTPLYVTLLPSLAFPGMCPRKVLRARFPLS